MHFILYILYMSNRTSIAVSKETLEELHSAKFEFRVNTLESAIKGLLEEHRSEPGTQVSSDESLKKLQKTFIEKAEKVVELLPKVDEAMERRSKRMVEK